MNITRLCAALVVAAPLIASAADCAVVYGQGETPPSPDTLVNDHWNRLNFSFHDAFHYQLSESGMKVLPVFMTVQSIDAAANAEKVRKALDEGGCSRMFGLRVFSDEGGAAPELVFAVSAAPVSRKDGTATRVEPAEYKKEYRFAATPESLARVVPSRLAAQAVRDLPDKWKR